MSAWMLPLLALALLVLVRAQTCANSCSGHGFCDPSKRCTCFAGYSGADCSLRKCDVGFRWWGKPTGDSSAVPSTYLSTHEQEDQCAGAGTCDPESGLCTCLEGLYSGPACELSVCPTDSNSRPCGGNGQCRTMRELQRLGNVAGAVSPAQTYANWDADRIQGCYCDAGFAGYDCALNLCKRGDNPRTKRQQRRVIQLDVNRGTVAAGYRRLRFFFAGATSDPIDLDSLTTANCVSRFGTTETLGMTGASCMVVGPGQNVQILQSDSVNGPGQWRIALAIVFPVDNHQNNFFAHDGEPSIDMFRCAFDEGISVGPPGMRGNPATDSCAVSYIDVNTLTLTGSNPGDPPPSIPVGSSYSISIVDTTVIPNRAVITLATGGSNVSTSSPLSVDSLSTLVGLDTLTFRIGPVGALGPVAARWGHTMLATWTVSSPSAGLINVVAQPGYREYDWCSGQGRCDFSSGTCTCLGDAFGGACEALASDAASESDLPGFLVRADNPLFEGTVLEVRSRRSFPSNDFNYIRVGDDNGDLLTLGANEVLTGNVMNFRKGGTVDRGLVAKMSPSLVTAFASTPALSVYFGSAVPPNTPQASTEGVLRVHSDFPTDLPGSNYAILSISAKQQTPPLSNKGIFGVLGEGSVAITGPVNMNGGAGAAFTMATGDLVVSSGRILSQSLYSATGIQVGPGTGTQVVLSPTGAISAASLSVGTGLTSITTGISASTFTINAGGLSVSAGGIRVSGGGLSVAGGGVQVTSGAVSTTTNGFVFGDPATTKMVGQFGFPTVAGVPFVNSDAGIGGAISALSTGFKGTGLHIDVKAGATDFQYIQMQQFGAASIAIGGDNTIQGRPYLVMAGMDNTGSPVSIMGSRQTSGGTLPGYAVVAGGNTNGAFAAGDVSILGGSASASAGSGGDINLLAGFGAAKGGAVSVQTGSATDSGSIAGDMWLEGGTAQTTGGNVFLRSGGSPATPGSVSIMTQAGSPLTSTLRLAATGAGGMMLDPGPGSGILSIQGSTSVAGSVSISTHLSAQSILSTASLVVQANAISLLPTAGVGAAGGHVLAQAGNGPAGQVGGAASLVAGASADTTGGFAVVRAGAGGTGTGGSVLLQPGTGTTNSGGISLQSADGTSRLVLAGNGNMLLNPTGTLSLGGATSVAGNLTVSTTDGSSMLDFLRVGPNAITVCRSNTACPPLVFDVSGFSGGNPVGGGNLRLFIYIPIGNAQTATAVNTGSPAKDIPATTPADLIVDYDDPSGTGSGSRVVVKPGQMFAAFV